MPLFKATRTEALAAYLVHAKNDLQVLGNYTPLTCPDSVGPAGLEPATNGL